MTTLRSLLKKTKEAQGSYDLIVHVNSHFKKIIRMLGWSKDHLEAVRDQWLVNHFCGYFFIFESFGPSKEVKLHYGLSS